VGSTSGRPRSVETVDDHSGVMTMRTLRMDLLHQPAFWAAHMWNVTRGAIAGGDPEIIDAAFDIPTDAIEAFYLRELSDELNWPYFNTPLRSGYAVEVEYADEPEDYEVVYRVCQQEWTSSICVGKLLVERLITASQSDVRWQRQKRLGWVNDGDNSMRTPDRQGCIHAHEFSGPLAFFNAGNI
jgi:hypothetical protein